VTDEEDVEADDIPEDYEGLTVSTDLMLGEDGVTEIFRMDVHLGEGNAVTLTLDHSAAMNLFPVLAGFLMRERTVEDLCMAVMAASPDAPPEDEG